MDTIVFLCVCVVLADPHKKAIYDTTGIKGLETDGWEVVNLYSFFIVTVLPKQMSNCYYQARGTFQSFVFWISL